MNALVIGCGHIGTQRARILKRLGVGVSLFDADQARASVLANEFGVAQSCDPLPDRLAKAHDVALICTPPDSHLDLAIQAADAGMNLFIEKPLAVTLDQPKIARLVRALQEHGAWGMMGQSYRFHPTLREFRETVDVRLKDAPLIAAYLWAGHHLADWHPGDDYKHSYSARIGATLEMLSHSLDTVNWLFGEPLAIMAATNSSGRLGIQGDESATCIVRVSSGAYIVVHADYWRRPYQFKISATFAADEARNHLKWSMRQGSANAMHEREMQALVSAVEKGRPPQPDLFQGIKILEWLDAARRSAKSGKAEMMDGYWKELAGRG